MDATVSWCVARDHRLKDLVAQGTTVAAADWDHTVHVDVTGVFERPPPTTTGSTCRAPSPPSVGPGPCRMDTSLGPGSPRHRAPSSTPASSTPTTASPNEVRSGPRFVLHLGDYIYEASNTPPKNQTPGVDIGRPFDPLHECVTLSSDHRTRYRQYVGDPSVQRVRAVLRSSPPSTTTSWPTAPGGRRRQPRRSAARQPGPTAAPPRSGLARSGFRSVGRTGFLSDWWVYRRVPLGISWTSSSPTPAAGATHPSSAQRWPRPWLAARWVPSSGSGWF